MASGNNSSQARHSQFPTASHSRLRTQPMRRFNYGPTWSVSSKTSLESVEAEGFMYWRLLSRVSKPIGSVVCLLTMMSCGSDWPAFRHNTLRSGDQLNNGPLTNPAKVAGLSVRWTFPVGAVNPAPGPFRAGPIVYKGVVYIGNANGYFYAIKANDGSLKWVYPGGGAQALTSTFTCNPSSEGIASSAMIGVIRGTDAVIFGAPDRSIGTHLGSGRLFALNTQTGAEIWKSPEIGVLRADGVTHQQIGYSSPLVFNNHVYIGLGDHCDNPIQQGKVVAVKLSDGTIDGAFSFSSTGPPRGG